MKKSDLKALIKEEIQNLLKETKYIGRHVNHPIVTNASKEAASQSGFSSNQHYIFEKGFLKGVEWFENMAKDKNQQ
jgi:hypothetical protein